MESIINNFIFELDLTRERASSINDSCCLLSVGYLTVIVESMFDPYSPLALAIDLILSSRNVPPVSI
jgi:hypothetical protein